MKYIIVGVMLIMTLLVSKIFVALDLLHFNKYTTRLESNQQNNKLNQLEKTGKSLYLVYCSSCHGYDGKGNKEKAQDHTHRMSKKSIIDVINNGANNFKSLYPSGMPSGLINQDEAEKVATFMVNGFKGPKPKSWIICASCHDNTGEGIPLIAPNIKTYSDELVETVLKNGKQGVIGVMPSDFKHRLSKNQMKAIATYIRSLGK